MYIIKRIVTNSIYGLPLYSEDSNIYDETSIIDIVEKFEQLKLYFDKIIEKNNNFKYIQEEIPNDSEIGLMIPILKGIDKDSGYLYEYFIQRYEFVTIPSKH